MTVRRFIPRVFLVLALAAWPLVGLAADADGAGIDDGVDPCTNVASVVIDVPKLRIRKVDEDGGGRIRFAGSLTVPTTPAIDPVAKGLRLVVRDGGGATTIDTIIPPGAFDPDTRRGWLANGSGRTFRYRDSEGLVGGIEKVVVRHGVLGSGLLKVIVFGRHGVFPLPEVLPVHATVVIDAPIAASGQCGEGTFETCFFRNEGRKLICR
jgi:hypothetical protein